MHLLTTKRSSLFLFNSHVSKKVSLIDENEYIKLLQWKNQELQSVPSSS